MANKTHLAIELNRDPDILLAYAPDWACPKCGRHIALLTETPGDGDEISCPFCMMDKAGKDFILISGWQLTKSSANHINASRVKQHD